MTVLDRADIVIGGNIGPLQASLAQARSNLNRAGAQLGAIGSRLTSRITLPLLGIGAAATKVASSFEREMSRIEGLVGIAGEQVDAWGQDILEMAPELGAAPQELAEGLFFVTSAGFRGSEAMDVLNQSARASAAGLGAVATVADTVTSAVNAYGSENLSAASATDILTAAVREGKLEAESLAPVMGNLLPTASAMGISFEQVAGMLAVFSRTGADAASSATTLNRLMLTLQKNTGPAVQLLNSAGLSLSDLRDIAAGEDGLIGVMRLLDDTFADNEEALAQLFPNIRAFRGVMNALAQDAETVDNIMAGVADSSGSADAAFQAAAETGSFKLQQAWRRLQVQGIRIGNIIMPTIARVVTTLTSKLSSMSSSTLEQVVRFSALAAAAGPLITAMAVLIRSFSIIIGIFTPLGAGIAAVAGLVIGIKNNWLGMGEAALRAWQSIAEVVPRVLNSVLNTVKPALNFIIGFFVGTAMAAVESWDIIKFEFIAAMKAIRDWARPVLEGIAKGLSVIGQFGRIAAFEIRQALTKGADEGEEGGRNIAQRIASGFADAFSRDYVGAFVRIVREGVGRAQEFIQRAIERLRGLAGGAQPAIDALEDANTALDGVNAGLEETDPESGNAGQSFSRLSDAASSVADNLSSVFSDLISGAKGFAEAVKSAAASIIADIGRIIARALILRSLFSVFPGFGNFLGGFTQIAGRAHGGAVRRNQPYIVGERGPELFVPNSAGEVVSSEGLAAAGGGGATVVFDTSRLPAPRDPRQAARDPDWIRFISHTLEEYRANGGRFGQEGE